MVVEEARAQLAQQMIVNEELLHRLATTTAEEAGQHNLKMVEEEI